MLLIYNKLRDDELYVMLMLMRSEGGSEVSEETDCDDPLVVLACNSDSDACPAACKEDNTDDEDEVVKAGDLDVETSGNSNGNLFIGRDSELDTISLKTSEEVTITKIVLERIGYSTKDNITSVKLEDEKGATIADAKTLDSKGQVKLTLKKDYKVVDGELNAVVVVNTKNATTALTPGATVGFKVVDVESTAKNVNISGKANTYTAINFNGSQITFTIRKNANKEYNWSAGELYEVAKFKVAAPEDSSIVFRGFTLSKNNSTLDLRKYFDSAEVTIAGEKVSGLEASVNKDDELVVTFKDVEIAAKEKAEVIVKIALVEDFDQFNGSNVVVLGLKDFVAVDGKVESRVSATNTLLTNEPYYGEFTQYTFKGGKVKIANVKLGNVDAAEDSEDTVVAEGTITVPEAIKGTFTITASGPGVAAVKQMTVVVNGEETDADPVWTPASCVYNTCTSATFTFKNVEIEKSGKVKFLLDIKQFSNTDSNAERNYLNNKTINFTSFGIDSFANTSTAVVYDESNKSARSEISGSISFSKVTIQPAKASLTNSATKDVEFANKETNKKVVFDGTYTAKKGDVKLNEFVIESKATTMADLGDLINNGTVEYNKVRFYVTIDGDEVSDAKITCTPAGAGNATACTAGDTFDNILVKAGESVKVLVEAEVEANDVLNGAGTAFDTTTTYNGNSYVSASSIALGKYQITLKGEDVNGNKAGEGAANTAALKVVIKGSITLGSDNSKNTVLKKASDALIASFTVKPANGASETDLESIVFNVAGASTLSNENDITVKLNKVVVDDCTVANGTSDTVTCTMTEKIGSEGVSVDISLVNEESNTVTVDTLVINGKSQSRSYTRKFVDSYVKIDSQKDLGGKTQFTLDVDEDSDYAVSDLVIFFDNTVSALSVANVTAAGEKLCNDGASPTPAAVSCFAANAANTEEVLSHGGDAAGVAYIKGAFGDGDTVEVKGLSNNSRDVTAIAYKAGNAWVIIQKSSFNDFFKVSDGTYARAFQTSK